MQITRAGSQPSTKGPADWFTGTVRIDAPFKGTDPARVTGAAVSFIRMHLRAASSAAGSSPTRSWRG